MLHQISAILKRVSNRHIKRFIWDKEFSRGQWDYLDNSPDDIIYYYLEKYSNDGDVLDLGCGSGNTGNEINVNKYRHYTGVDISEHAIQKAVARSNSQCRAHKNTYVVSDISSYIPEKKYDVLLFRESIMYVPIYKIKKMLDRYSGHLKEDGVFIVRMCDAERFTSISNLIVKNYRVIEKHLVKNTMGIIIVFQ